MSISSAHAAAFYREAVAEGAVWTIANEHGFPAPRNPAGQESVPFWSKESRAQRIVDRVDAYADYGVVRIDLGAWTSTWVPDLKNHSLRVGVNWSGDSATGFDMEPDHVLARIEAEKTEID